MGLNFACTSTTGSPMDKWMQQADSAHQIGPETILQDVLIVVESGGTGGKNKSCRNFSLSEIGPDFACTSTTGSPMDKWTLQVDSAHQTGLKPIRHAVLIVVESGGTGVE